MIRIGIPTQGFRDWAGGVDFLFSVVDSLRAAPADVELHLLDVAPRAPRSWKRLRRAIVEALGGRTPERITPALDCTEIAARCDAEHRLTDDNGALVAASRHLHLDAVLPSHGVLPDSLPCPWIGYLYDFQHRHLPHLFTDRERRKRKGGELIVPGFGLPKALAPLLPIYLQGVLQVRRAAKSATRGSSRLCLA